MCITLFNFYKNPKEVLALLSCLSYMRHQAHVVPSLAQCPTASGTAGPRDQAFPMLSPECSARCWWEGCCAGTTGGSLWLVREMAEWAGVQSWGWGFMGQAGSVDPALHSTEHH